jgi:UDP-N-acetylglucosamine 2-epimerase (non-hydrolysing)
VTGNTVVDVALDLLPDARERADLLRMLNLTTAGFILATFHRPENVDDPDRLALLLEHLGQLGLPVYFPVHPRTQERIRSGDLGDHASIRMAPPIGYRTFLGLAAESAFLVSDSGGVQEEASVVKRPVIVVRRSTERPEVLGTFATLVSSPADLRPLAARLLQSLDDTHRHLSDVPTPYGDGRASTRCVRHVAEALTRWARNVEGNPSAKIAMG